MLRMKWERVKCNPSFTTITQLARHTTSPPVATLLQEMPPPDESGYA